MWRIALAFISLSMFLASAGLAQDDLDGLWEGQLESPGGELVFGLKVVTEDDLTTAYLINGPEVIKVPKTMLDENRLTLDFPHYDSQIEVVVSEQREAMTGTWRKTRGKEKVSEMVAHFRRPGPEATSAVENFIGKWAVEFSESDDPAIAIIRSVEGDANRCEATFRTTTGDYRYLSGTVEEGRLRLSVFDGAHAFLFYAKRNENDELVGDFWSSKNWHETWTAKRNDDAQMPDAFAETTWRDQDLADFKFPNLEGEPTSLNDPAFTGKPRLVHVFGSWCPNCHDAGIYLGELTEKYGDDLSVLGLAFELTGDFERDANQVRLFHERHETDYPVLIAGLADKSLASKTIPFLDRVRSYPTTIFIDADGKVVAIHTGFNGPATGEAYEKLKEEFESRIDKMIEIWKNAE